MWKRWLMARSYAGIFAACLVLVSVDVAEGAASSLKIEAEEVRVEGPMEVKAASNIKNIGQGIMQIRDKGMKTAILIGTSTRAGSGPAQRIQAIEGAGIALTSAADKGGVYVASSSGRVGINDASSKFKGILHVTGGIMTDKLVAPYSGKKGPAVLLRRGEGHNTVVLGKPESSKLQFALGRGKLQDRAMTFTVPSVQDYGGAGKSPYIMFMSPKKVLAAFKAGSSNFFVAGNVGLTQDSPKAPWKSGTKSNLHVKGSIRLEARDKSSDDAALYFPASGKKPSFSLRTGTAQSADAIDTKLFITGGKDKASVGINTLAPKTRLDVRGHLNLEGDDKGDAVIYFPSSGKNQGFYVRSSATPKPKTDAKDTRFFIHPKGFVGINTIEPKHGICLESKAGTAKGTDMLIKKGNLHLNGGLMDLDGKHALSLDGKNNLKAINIETGFTVGTAKPYEGSKHVLHIQGSKNPKLMISQTMMKPVAIILQVAKKSWTLQGDPKNLNLASAKKTQSKFFFTKKGHIVVGKRKPEFALQIETDAKEGDKANSVYIGRGGLRIKGAINKMSTYKGKPIVWRLYPAGFSNMKDIGITGKLAIGTEKKMPWSLYVAQGRTIDVGGFGFLYSSDDKGTISFNEYVVSVGGEQEKKLHDKKAFAAALRLGNDGDVSFEGTKQRGSILMSKLMNVSPSKNRVTFEKYSDFGMSGGGASMRFPLRVKGGTTKKMTTIAFGHLSDSMGLLGSTAKFLFLGTRDEKKFLAIHHNGKVGLGTTNPTEELTLRTKKAQSDVYLTSDKRPGRAVLLSMDPSGSTKLSIKGSSSLDAKSGRMHVQDYTEMAFLNAGAKASTVFDRGGKPKDFKKGAKFVPPGVEFRTGNVGFGVEVPKRHLHIGGAHWSQGKLIVKNGFGRASMMAEMMAMIEVGEGSSPATSHSDGTDVGQTLLSLTRLVRRNKQRLKKQATSIALMERELAALRSR